MSSPVGLILHRVFVFETLMILFVIAKLQHSLHLSNSIREFFVYIFANLCSTFSLRPSKQGGSLLKCPTDLFAKVCFQQQQQQQQQQQGEGEQGWRSGESTRLPPVWPGFDSRTWRHMWVEFVQLVLSLLREVFLRVLRFSPLLKKQHF